MSKVDFKIAGNGAYYWIAVDKGDLKVVNGKASKNLAPGGHYLTWYAVGPSGVAMTITTTQNGVALGAPYVCTIPAGEGHAAGIHYFTVV